MKNFNLITANKFSHTLALLAYATRAFEGHVYVLKYADANDLQYEGRYNYKDLCAFDNRNVAYRAKEPIAIVVDGISYDVRHTATINTPAMAGKVSNKYGVYFPECFDLGRTLVKTQTGVAHRDFGRTFANYIGVLDASGKIVIYGPRFFTTSVNTAYGEISLGDDAESVVPNPTPVSRDDNIITLVGDTERKDLHLFQRLKVDGNPVAAETYAGAIIVNSIVDALDKAPNKKLYSDFISAIINDPIMNTLDFQVYKDGSGLMRNDTLDSMYYKIRRDYSGDALLNKLKLLYVRENKTNIKEVVVLINTTEYDVYSESSTDTNQTCAVQAAAMAFYYNTYMSKDLSPLSGQFFSYVGIIMSKGYAENFDIGNGQKSVRLVYHNAGDDSDIDKQNENNVYFSGDLDPNTSLMYRVFRSKALPNSAVVVKVPGREHYVCGKYDEGTGTILVLCDSLGVETNIEGTVITQENKNLITTFGGFATSFDGEFLAENNGITRTLNQVEIAYRFNGVGGINA